MALSPNPSRTLGFPRKFELALLYGEGPLFEVRSRAHVCCKRTDSQLRRAVFARRRRPAAARCAREAGACAATRRITCRPTLTAPAQAQFGPCNEARPSMFDPVAKARWTAWKELGQRSKMEAMFLYTQAVEEFAPDWWQWPELGLVDADGVILEGEGEGTAAANGVAGGGGAAAAREEGVKVAAASAPSSAESPTGGAGDGGRGGGKDAAAGGDGGDGGGGGAPLAVGGWQALPEAREAPARYRHGCAVVGARLFVFGGRLSRRAWVDHHASPSHSSLTNNQGV